MALELAKTVKIKLVL